MQSLNYANILAVSDVYAERGLLAMPIWCTHGSSREHTFSLSWDKQTTRLRKPCDRQKAESVAADFVLRTVRIVVQTKEQAFERWSGNIARTIRAVVTTMIRAFGSASLFGAHIAMGAGSQTC